MMLLLLMMLMLMPMLMLTLTYTDTALATPTGPTMATTMASRGDEKRNRLLCLAALNKLVFQLLIVFVPFSKAFNPAYCKRGYCSHRMSRRSFSLTRKGLNQHWR